MDTIQRESIEQNLRKLAETAGFSDIYAQDYSGYFKNIKDCIYLNGTKNRPQDISLLNIFIFVNLKNDSCFSRMALLHLRKIGYIIRIVYFHRIFFLSIERNLKQMRKTNTNKPTIKRSTHTFCRIFRSFFRSINKILLDAQIKEYFTKYQQNQTHMMKHKTIQTHHLQHHNYPVYTTVTHYH